MQSGTEPLGQELAKEMRELRTRLGARRLGAERAVKLEETDEATRRAVREEAEQDDGLDLLWPPGQQAAGARLGERALQDLEIETLVQALASGSKREHHDLIRRVLGELCRDPEAIRYRQAISGDLIRDQKLAHGIEELLPRLDQLNAYSMADRDMPELFQLAWWLGEMETYVDCIRATVRVFAEADDEPRSAGLCALRDQAVEIEARDSFQTLARKLPPLLACIRGVTSITIGVNLDQDLQPVAATLLSLNEEPFSEAPLLRLLLGGSGSQGCVMPLHTMPLMEGGSAVPQPGRRARPMLVPLFRDLSRIMEQVSKPIAAALQAYIQVNRRWLVRIRPALAFYAGAARLARRLQESGLPVCLPEIVPEAERICQVADGYNVNLALHHVERGGGDQTAEIVTNDVSLDDEGRIAILTGPNRGGKTTYTQAIGLMQVLAQVGLFVPGSQARISPADGVYTHFPTEEELVRGTGRFGDEAQRLRQILEQATRHSLILLNEALSGTYAGESLYLSRDVVLILRMLGARVVFATHLHELAEQVEAINTEAAGDSHVVSLVSSRIDQATTAQGAHEAAERRSYRVVRSRPMGRSYALELARHYGISLDQLRQVLMDRGVIDLEEPGASEP
jgi:DNA mismatch repair protein MutS